MTHANAALTPRRRLRVAWLVVDGGHPISEAAARFQVSRPTMQRWADRYLTRRHLHNVRVTPAPKPQALRDAISAALCDTKSYSLPARCASLGLEDGTEEEAFASKNSYVQKRVAGLANDELMRIARSILADQDDASLEELVTQAGLRGVQGELRNLIFASTGKPEIVLRDATRNVIEITRNADKCLIYDKALPDAGLTWRELVHWWSAKSQSEVTVQEAGRQLWRRLAESLDSDPERCLLHTYSTRYAANPDMPALLPQVWLHYDPFLRSGGRPRPAAVARQRMDFLLLMPSRRCVVLEIDGKHHYAKDDRADPHAYARMVSEDRRLRLAGYEVYRFGGAEFTDRNKATAMLTQFFNELVRASSSPSL